jgi:acetolactate synthase-1/2/3 large subunit
MRPITKWSVSVPETRRLAEYVQSALRVATSGVPGPVFLEMPIDVLFVPCEESDVVEYAGFQTEARAAGDPAYLDRAANAIAVAERPMLIVGSQWRWSARRDALAQLLAIAPMPTYVSGMARGALAPEDPNLFARSRRDALSNADVVVVLGTPLDFRLGYGEAIRDTSTLIQADLDGAEIGRNRRVDIGIVGDTGLVLAGLAQRLSDRAPSVGPWIEQIAAKEEERRAPMRAELDDASDPVNPLYLCGRVARYVDENTVVVGDGGDFVAIAANVIRTCGVGSWMDPGPLGTLGVGPGYAMAAKLAHPTKRVVLMSGDGTFGLNGFEVEAMVRQGIEVTVIIGNDGAWTQIRRGQVDMYGADRVVATELARSRYDVVGQALGAHGEHVTRAADLDAALARAFGAGKTSVVNVEIGTSAFRRGALSV